jgi:hypothetical protein
MPYFPGNFTAEQLEVMRGALAEASAILGARGKQEMERDLALIILSAAYSGCFKKDDLVALATAVFRKRRESGSDG